MQHTIELIAQQCQLATQALDGLPLSDARSALCDLTASLSARASSMA